MISPIAAIFVGIVLLVFGQRLFWLFVAAMGFIVGTQIAAVVFHHHPGWIIISALFLGLGGAMLAIFLQKMAIGIAGFMAGGYFLMTLLNAWALQAPEHAWISVLVGGIAGAVLMVLVFDWALIVSSSISGAYLIIHSFHINQAMASALFLALLVLGIVVQRKLSK
jgi:hypothetical protein